ncbi:unnamed protein product [Ceutorhynchus assimilis]|uniref:Uncharacterized protein n=1 Tax=Ceutorhynchus assimilis TaxID=467358 RepID=A0A9N9MGX6_9CUCU|nr:unnamed protein product [Ceutorhynchus assimilis]
MAPNPKISAVINNNTSINEAIQVLFKIKMQIVTKIEETKRKIRNYKQLTGGKVSIVQQEELVALFDRDISHIQNLHDVVVQDLESLKKSLQNHAAIVEKTELITNILDYKLYDIQFQFRNQIDKLKERKEECVRAALTGQDDSSLALKHVEIDDEIEMLEESHQTNLECIKEQKLDAQKAYEGAARLMDDNLDNMTDGLNKLLVLIEAEKSTLGDSQSRLVDAKFAAEVATFEADIEKFTQLQTCGWKQLHADEKISEILQEGSLKMLKPGQLITDRGQQSSYEKAKVSKLINELDTDVLRELRGNLDESTSSSASIDSEKSTEDTHYLKHHLGRPLTQALKEITSLQPRDPVHYLGHWLFNYRYNQQTEEVKKSEWNSLHEQRERLAKERYHRFVQEEAREAVLDMIVRAEEIVFLQELTRMQDAEEEADEEAEGLNDEARDTLGPYTGPTTGQRPL